MTLSEDAKALIGAEVESLLKEQRSLLQELNIYRWALRVLFVALLGGSVVGVLKARDYLDDRIQKRSEELSGMVYGSAAQSAGDFRTAIEQYYPYLATIEDPLLRPAESIRSIYYYRFIQALADDTSVDPTGEFLSLPAFNALISSKVYQKDIFANQRKWNQDQAIMNAWARAQIKYGKGSAAIQEALSYVSAAVSYAERPSDKAANYFAAALICLSMNRIDDARKYMLQAHETSPRTHGLQLFYAESSKDIDFEIPMWERAARIMGQPNFRARYDKFMKDLQASKHIQARRDA